MSALHPGTASSTLHVRVLSGQRVLPGATVAIPSIRRGAVTDQLGGATLEKLPLGPAWILVAPLSGGVRETTVTLLPGDTTITVHVFDHNRWEVDPKHLSPGFLVVSVTRRDGQTLPDGLPVYLRDGTGDTRRGQSDKHGIVYFDWVPAGVVKVWVPDTLDVFGASKSLRIPAARTIRDTLFLSRRRLNLRR